MPPDFYLLLIALYILIGEGVLQYNLKHRYLRPLTDKELFTVVMLWPLYL